MRLRNWILPALLAAIVAATPVLHAAHVHHRVCESSSGTVDAQCAVCAVACPSGLQQNPCADLAREDAGTDYTARSDDPKTDTAPPSADTSRSPPAASV